MLTIVSPEGDIKAYSQNLNVFFHYERRNKTLPVLIEMTKLPNYAGMGGNGLLKATYENGDTGEVHFGSYKAMEEWVLGRRNWKGIEIKRFVEGFENGSTTPIVEVESF